MMAAATGGDPVNVENVFSTHLYTGAGGTTATINNGIDLLNEGGLVWIKARNATESHGLFDTVRGVTKYISSNNTNAEATNSGTLTNFYDNGFKVDGNGIVGSSLDPYVSWSFRKAKKFFDIVTYTGSGGAKTISHSLGSTPGMIFVKNLSTAQSWYVFHTSVGATKGLILDGTYAAVLGSSYWNDTAPTSTQFTVGANASDNGDSYVAYLFAHNNSDGGFGPDSDQDIIKCGSYTGAGSGSSTTVNLGFEPQFVLLKNISSSSAWSIVDSMRGIVTGGNDQTFEGDTTGAEYAADLIDLTSTGFVTKSNFSGSNTSGHTFVYMAIRRGPMAVPEDVTKVFHVNNYSGNSNSNIYNTGFDVDMNINTKTGGYAKHIISRLTGKNLLKSDSTDDEVNYSTVKWFDSKSNHIDLSTSWLTTHNDVISYSWRRAPGFFDVVCYDGTGSAKTVAHNLGVVPEMIWVKNRGYSGNEDWSVYHKGVNGGTDPEDYILKLNSGYKEINSANDWNDTAPTSTVFTVGSDRRTNALLEASIDNRYVAYLFATLAGVSKVGSYTGNGSSSGPTVDCGFSNGPKLVIIKRASDGSNDNWIVFDTVRGLSSGNDHYIALDNTDAEFSNVDWIDPTSSGFQVVQSNSGVNASGDTYIFYAVAV